MANELARMLITSDDHYCSKNYGGHNNYSKETIYYADIITGIMRERQITHWVGLGDLTFGRFTTLEYRREFLRIMRERHDIVGDNMWYIKGNHDSSSAGVTEYEFYLSEGLFKGAEDIQIGSVNIFMENYGKHERKLACDKDKINVLMTHGYYKFKDSNLPNYGDALILDNFDNWSGVNYIFSGHIHQEHLLDGYIGELTQDSTKTMLWYLPCLNRPAFMRAGMPEVGRIVELIIYDDGTMKIEDIEIPLLPIEESFNLSVIEAKDTKQELIKVDISDVAKRLTDGVIGMGDAREIIKYREDIDERYRAKALQYLDVAENKTAR